MMEAGISTQDEQHETIADHPLAMASQAVDLITLPAGRL
jgi:hypothetical protein